MSREDDWSIPSSAQPRPQDVAFDLDTALAGVVQLHAEIAGDAFTAPILGTERYGSGVVISERGLVVTIGYLVTEAEAIWLTTNRHTAVQAHLLGFDFATGFALLQTLGRIDVPPLRIGSSESVGLGEPVVLAAGGGRKAALQSRLVGKRSFAGYWEYYLDEALFTVPAHPHWGGTACIAGDGSLIGIGSLLIQAETADRRGAAGNMVVPIDLLPPILDDLRRFGRVDRPARPWLGLYAMDAGDGVVVTGLAPNGPAAQAGIAEGDTIVDVAGEPIDDLADLWQRVWELGPAGVPVPLTLERNGRPFEVVVPSSERERFLKAPRLH